MPISKTINDLERSSYLRNIVLQTDSNGASAITKRVTLNQGVNYFAFDVPAGRKVYLWERILTLSEGEYEVDVQRCDDFTVGGATSMIVSPLDGTTSTSITANFYFGVTSPTNVTTVEEGYANVATGQGSGTTNSALAEDFVYKAFTGKGLLRINKLDAGSVTGNLLLVAWEEDA